MAMGTDLLAHPGRFTINQLVYERQWERYAASPVIGSWCSSMGG